MVAVALEAAGPADNNLWFDTVSERGIRSLDTLPREQPWRDESKWSALSILSSLYLRGVETSYQLLREDSLND